MTIMQAVAGKSEVGRCAENMRPTNDQKRHNHLQWITDACGLTVFAIGFIGVIGWIAGVSGLTRVSDNYIPLAMDTAVALIAFGVLLRTLRYRYINIQVRYAQLLTAIIIAVYGLLKALEFPLGMDLTLANTFFPVREYLGRHITNRMSPLSGALFFLSGLGAVALLWETNQLIRRQFVGGIGVVVSGVGFLLTYGYVLNNPFFYQASLIPISVLAALGFTFGGIALLASAGPDSVLAPFFETSVKSRVLKLFLPLIVLTCFAQQILFQLSSATDLNRALIILLVPLAASAAAVVAASTLAQYLSVQIGKANLLLEESEEKHRSVVEHSHDLYWTVDTSGAFVNANKRCYEITGYDAPEWIGTGFAAMLELEDLPRVQEIFLRTLRGEPQDYEVRVKRKDGSHFYLEVTSVPEYKAGEIIGVASFGRDITERKQSELALRESERLLRASQSIALLGSYDLDLKTMVWTNSQELDKLWGMDKDFPRTPDGWLTLLHPDWKVPMEHYFKEEVLAKRKRFDKEYVIVRHSDGQARWVHGLGDLTFDDLGNPVRMIGTIQDISDRKKLEAEREALEVQLRQAQKMETIGTLAGGVAHDFNNILTPILVYSDMAAQELGADHPQRQDLEQVIAGANRAKELVKQILTFSRQMEHERVPLHLSAIVKEALKLIKASLPSSISIETHIQAENVEVLADPSQIHQVVMNLCTNAYQAMRETGGTLSVRLNTVSISAEDAKSMPSINPGSYVQLTVADTGSGIDDSIRERIFEPFFTTKMVGEGTGLGLSVVHGIVKSHDGAIILRSEPNNGAMFDVYFPVICAQLSSQGADQEVVIGGDESILVVDDQIEVAQALKDVLEKRYGYKVIACSNSHEAVDLVRSHPSRFDMLILDQTMPGLSGVQIAHEVRSTFPNLAIVLMTGYSETIDEERCRQLGVTEVIMKPPAAAELGRTVRKVLDLSKAKRLAAI